MKKSLLYAATVLKFWILYSKYHCSKWSCSLRSCWPGLLLDFQCAVLRRRSSRNDFDLYRYIYDIHIHHSIK